MKWWKEEALKEVADYFALITGTCSTAFFVLLMIMAIFIEIPVLFAELRTLPVYILWQNPNIGTMLIVSWPAFNLALVLLGPTGFAVVGVWFLHKAYQNENWYQNSELTEKVNKVGNKGENEKPIK